jgi:hypothetical protein
VNGFQEVYVGSEENQVTGENPINIMSYEMNVEMVKELRQGRYSREW